MAGKLVDTLKRNIQVFFDAFYSTRVPPLGQDAPGEKKDAVALSQLLLVTVLVLVSRSFLAGGGISLSVPAMLAGVALAAVILVSLLAYIFYPKADPKTQSLRGSVFVMCYLILTIMLFILIDGVGLFALGQAPSTLLADAMFAVGLDPVRFGDFLTALVFSLLAWILLTVRTVLQFPPTSWTDAFWTPQFPTFVLMNAGLFYVVILA